MGYPPIYSCMSDMPAEVGMVLDYCIRTEQAVRFDEQVESNDYKALDLARMNAEAMWDQLGIMPIRNM
jgi:hypothetical protein